MIVQTFTFQLVAGTDVERFLEADARVQEEWAYQQPGLVRRTMARSTDGEWMVLIFWDSPEHVVTAPPTDPSTRAFAGFIEHSSVRMSQYETLD